MAIQHFAFAKFKAGMSDNEKEAAFEAVRTLLGSAGIPGLTSTRVGPPIDPTRTQGYEFALVAEFTDIQAFRAYLPHPQHIRLLGMVKDFTDAEKGLLLYQIDTSKISKL